MADIGIAVDKAPAGVTCAYRSDGETIPWVAAGGESVGDVIERDANSATQAIGIVSALTATEMTQGVTTDNPTGDAVAVALSEIQLRIYGMFYVPIVDGTYADGARVEYISAGPNFGADETGAHQVVGNYVSGDTHALVRINVFPGPVTV